jgi:hypothetical protein
VPAGAGRCGGGAPKSTPHHHSGGNKRSSQVKQEAHTFERREATVEDQLKIAKVSLAESKSGEFLRLSLELGLARQIASEEVLKDTTVRSVGHCDVKVLWCLGGRKMNGNVKNRVVSRGFVKENRSWSTQSWGSTIAQVLLGGRRRRTDQKQRTRRMRMSNRRGGCALILNPLQSTYQRDIEKYLDLQAHPLQRVRIPHPPQYSYIHPVMISPLSPSPSSDDYYWG